MVKGPVFSRKGSVPLHQLNVYHCKQTIDAVIALINMTG